MTLDLPTPSIPSKVINLFTSFFSDSSRQLYYGLSMFLICGYHHFLKQNIDNPTSGFNSS